MTQGLSGKQLREIEKSGVIPPDIKKWDTSLHFCPEWDFMLVSKHDQAADACLCGPQYSGKSDD